MNSVRLTPEAKADLNDIWEYSAKQWNTEQAEAYMRALDATFHVLVLNPRLGRNIDDIRKGYFKFPTASHILIYRVNKAQVEIVRILHENSDVETRLRSEIKRSATPVDWHRSSGNPHITVVMQTCFASHQNLK